MSSTSSKLRKPKKRVSTDTSRPASWRKKCSTSGATGSSWLAGITVTVYQHNPETRSAHFLRFISNTCVPDDLPSANEVHSAFAVSLSTNVKVTSCMYKSLSDFKFVALTKVNGTLLPSILAWAFIEGWLPSMQ